MSYSQRRKPVQETGKAVLGPEEGVAKASVCVELGCPWLSTGAWRAEGRRVAQWVEESQGLLHWRGLAWPHGKHRERQAGAPE